jgi:Methyltransferase domain
MLMTTPALLSDREWHMATGERAALVGLVGELHPSVSIELGTFHGGSLRALAAHSEHVHSFDLTLQVDPDDYPNATFHVGDSHELLPVVLRELEAEDRKVEFALVDGDHSPEGVRRDVLDLLNSPAMRSGAIVLHDTGNEAVRRGLEEIPFADYEQVALIDLDFVPVPARHNRLAQVWGGLGLIVLDAERSGPGAVPVPGAERGAWGVVPELKRRTRRAAGLALRRAGVHPAQVRARRIATDRSQR